MGEINMSVNKKTVPNQKIVVVQKETCDKSNLYAAINLNAMNTAAIDLDAGAFKLWVYFAKNQDGYEFALSSKDAAENFGLKKKQYDKAVKELIEKGYLLLAKGNLYFFNEIAVVPKGNNDVVPKRYNVLYQKGTRNNTYNTKNNTIDNTGKKDLRFKEEEKF